MATGTFIYLCFAHENSKRAYKNTKKNCKSFKLDKSNAVSVGMTAIKPYLSICLVGLVWFARYCGKMDSRHLFAYGGLPYDYHFSQFLRKTPKVGVHNNDNKESKIFFLSLFSGHVIRRRQSVSISVKVTHRVLTQWLWIHPKQR